MQYKDAYTDEFLEIIRKLKKKDKSLTERLNKKIDEILKNPEHYKSLNYPLQGKRRVHIKSYVIVFEIKKDTVIFLTFKHHDFVYD